MSYLLKTGTELSKSKPNTHIALPVADGYVFVDIAEIIRCEGDGNYTMVILKNGEKQLVSKTLKYFEEHLSLNSFVRIHRSHLINLRCVKKYINGDGGKLIMVDNSELVVSRRNKEALLNKFSL